MPVEVDAEWGVVAGLCKSRVIDKFDGHVPFEMADFVPRTFLQVARFKMTCLITHAYGVNSLSKIFVARLTRK